MKPTLFVFRGTMQTRVLEKVDEQGPFDFLYGYDRYSFPKSYVVAPRGNRSSLAEKALYLVEKPFAMATKLGFPLEIASLFREEIGGAGTVFCINDAISLSMMFHKAMGRFDGRLVVLMQSLSERLAYFRRNILLVAGIARLLRAADSVLALSQAALEPLSETFGVPAEKLGVFRFGIDADYWTPAPHTHREDFVLSVGNDMNRDFETLFRALPPGMRVKLVTSKRVRNMPPEAQKMSGISDAELRRLYRTARCVVVPSTEIRYESSGLSTMLQAMACGAPVVASHAPAHEEYFAAEANVAYYKAGDAAELRRRLESLPPPPLGGRYVRYTTDGMAAHIERLVGGAR